MDIGPNINSQRKTNRIVCDGNSLGTGNGTLSNGWASQLYSILFSSGCPNFNMKNICVGAQDTEDMISRQSAFLYTNIISTAHNNIVIAMEVRNELMFGATNAQAFDRFKTYCQNAKNNGFYVIGVNHTPSQGGVPVGRTQAQMEIDRQIVRGWFLNDFNVSTAYSLIYKPSPNISYADLWVDVGGDSVMGNVANCSDTNLYTDLTHTTSLGASNIAVIMARGISCIMDNIK